MTKAKRPEERVRKKERGNEGAGGDTDIRDTLEKVPTRLPAPKPLPREPKKKL